MTVRYSIKNAKDAKALRNEFLVTGSLDYLNLYHQDDGDVILHLPKYLGWGYRQYIPLREGLTLAINNLELHDDFVVERLYFEPFEPIISLQPELVLDFCIEGQSSRVEFLSGSNYFTAAMPTPPGLGALLKRPKGERVFEIELTIRSPILQVLLTNMRESMPLAFKQVAKTLFEPSGFNGAHESPMSTYRPQSIRWGNPSTPEMQQVIRQILNCPYRGFNRRLYLEARSLDLINLWLDQTLQRFTQFNEPVDLESHDAVKQVYQARDILLSQYADPPSLSELSRQVGLNRRKLSEEFQQVFQKTLFGYLLDYRLEQAQRLLRQPDIKIEEVARAIGYTNQSKFAAAFRKKFGLNPKAYHQHYWERMI